MAPKFKLTGKKLAWMAVIFAIAAPLGVRWIQKPSEPIYEGKPLSWWLYPHSGHPHRMTRDQLRTLGPGAIDWLAYQPSGSF